MPNPPQAVIEATYGPIVAGLMVQQLLLGIVCVQVFNYYCTFPKDTLFYKSLVGVLLALNIFIGVIDFDVLYSTSVTHYGDYSAVDQLSWSGSAELAATVAIGAVAQIFFLERCYRASHSRPVMAVLSFMVLISFGFGIALSVSYSIAQHLDNETAFSIPLTGWLISTAVTDPSIALVLVVGLIRSKTPFRKTELVVLRITRLSMETSSTTAVVALLNLILFYALPGTAYHTIPQFAMCRIYTHTVMVTLASRTEIRNILFDEGHSSYVSRNGAVADDKWATSNIKVTTTVVHERVSWQEDPSDIELGHTDSKVQPDYDDNSFGESKIRGL